MQRTLGMLMALVLCCAAVAEEPPDARLREARAAVDEARTLWDEGRYADAIARGEQALALREAVLVGSHPDVARCCAPTRTTSMSGVCSSVPRSSARAAPPGRSPTSPAPSTEA